jgi:hypothetical protein
MDSHRDQSQHQQGQGLKEALTHVMAKLQTAATKAKQTLKLLYTERGRNPSPSLHQPSRTQAIDERKQIQELLAGRLSRGGVEDHLEERIVKLP